MRVKDYESIAERDQDLRRKQAILKLFRHGAITYGGQEADSSLDMIGNVNTLFGNGCEENSISRSGDTSAARMSFLKPGEYLNLVREENGRAATRVDSKNRILEAVAC